MVIDKQGFRYNVGIILLNKDRKVFWARRVGGKDAWQFPQGGLLPGEKSDDALFRELNEEVGLVEDDVTILGTTQSWLPYKIPDQLIRHHQKPICYGQKQKWYLLEFNTTDDRISLNHSDKPEFDDFRWVDYWYPVEEVIDFKRDVYKQALTELSRYLPGETLHVS